MRWIARRLDRSAATICRELARNSKPTKQWNQGYEPERAHSLALRRRRWDARHKLSRQPALRRLVKDRLAMGWSPEQIAGRLALFNGHTVISYESIYRFIYHRSAQKDYWHRLLPRRKHRRGRPGRRGGSPVNFIKHRVSVHQRSKTAAHRQQPGHWEADLMLFSTYGQAILVAHERHSRFTWITRQPSKAAKPVLAKLSALLAPLPAPLRRSITFDNGTEFALHHRLNAKLGIQTYFCDPLCAMAEGRCRKRHRKAQKTTAKKVRPGSHLTSKTRQPRQEDTTTPQENV